MQDAVRWLHTRDNTGDLLGCLYKVFMEVTGAVTLDHRSALSMVHWCCYGHPALLRFDCMHDCLDRDSLAWQLLEASEKVIIAAANLCCLVLTMVR